MKYVSRGLVVSLFQASSVGGDDLPVYVIHVFIDWKSVIIASKLDAVASSNFVTRRVLAKIVNVIYYKVWSIFALEYTLKG